MRVLHIALKDLLRSFRSAFLLVMMFVAPLLLTALIYFAFGRSGGDRFALPVTRIQVANLDQVDRQSGLSAGQMLADYLQSEELADLLALFRGPRLAEYVEPQNVVAVSADPREVANRAGVADPGAAPRPIMRPMSTSGMIHPAMTATDPPRMTPRAR